MKKLLGFAIVAFAVVATSAQAQQAQTAVATLHSDGSQEIRSTDASGKVATVRVGAGESAVAKVAGAGALAHNTSNQAAAVNTPSGKSPFVKHEAVLRADGGQEMHLTDAEGKITVITPDHGETVQQAYWKFLAKEGIPCACGGASESTSQQTKTATLPSSEQNGR
jgi:cytochrome oxidase Cu insertion factor (SCO1/SenC/PrrC family)